MANKNRIGVHGTDKETGRNKPAYQPGAKKTECPVTAEQFMKAAPPLTANFNGQSLVGAPKINSTGSFGYYLQGKITLDIGGTAVTFQVGANVTAVNSKPSAETTGDNGKAD